MMKKGRARCLAAATIAACSGAVHSTESGKDTVGLGAEGVMAGALPPPGFYGLFYYNNYGANSFADSNGNSMIPGFRVRANAVIPRLVYMTDVSVAGGLLGFYALFPLVSLSVHAAGAHDSRTGLGDIPFAALLSWHNGNLHWATAMEFVAPSGSYDKNRLANLGGNYFTFRPMAAITYSDPRGFEASAKASYSINTRNDQTQYQSGDYLAMDYSLGYRVIPALTLAVQGYFLYQTNDDKVNGVSAGPDGFRGRVLGIGPGIHYQAKHFSIEAKYVKETMVRNRPDGSSVWLKAIVPF